MELVATQKNLTAALTAARESKAEAAQFKNDAAAAEKSLAAEKEAGAAHAHATSDNSAHSEEDEVISCSAPKKSDAASSPNVTCSTQSPDLNNCFPMAIPRGGSEMASCDVCPSSLLSATVYRSIKDDGSCSSPQTWAETFYAVDPRTGCGACPAGTEPWQLRSISASRCAGLACDVRKSHSCYMKNTEFP